MLVYFEIICLSLQILRSKCLDILETKTQKDLRGVIGKEKDNISKCLPTMFLYIIAILSLRQQEHWQTQTLPSIYIILLGDGENHIMYL